MAIILNDVRVTDGEMFFDFYEISIGYIFVFFLAHIVGIKMEAPKESLMSNGKMVIIHDLDFSESKLERSLLQIPIQMKTLVFIYIPCEVRCTMHSNTKKFGVHTLLRFLGPRSLYIRSLSHQQCSRPFYLKRETQDLCEAEVVICFQRVHVQFPPCLQSAAA